MVMLTPSPLRPFPELIHTGAIQERTEQPWPGARFLLFCPNYCVASCAEISFSGFRA